MFRLPLPILAATALALSSWPALAADDIPLADFEGADYGAWKATGEAFGPGPALGTLPGQMKLSGFTGRGLVNSFYHGDDTKGRLVSPDFVIQRRNLVFLIGGGGFAGRTCLNLVADGKVVRTATGPNLKPGGSEALEPAFWDVADLAGRTVHIEVVDDATGGWGHINVDQIGQSDTPPPVAVSFPTRALRIDKNFLHFPVRTGAPKHRVSVLVDGKTVREFEIELAENPEWFAHLDVREWKGREAVIRADRLPAGGAALQTVAQADTIWSPQAVYAEPLRPLLHFSPRRGWTNDPNGLVFAQGEYHLFFQHNPYGWAWDNMHWGHAVSRDMVHWEELPVALYPPCYDDMAYSGSAVVDAANTSGWKSGSNDLLVAAFTSTGRGECIAYSNDRGRTWQEFKGNPVVRHKGRDPRLLWHEASHQWVMAVYDEDPPPGRSGGVRDISIHTSPDLKTWTYRSRIEGFFECPDLFELAVAGDPPSKKWIVTAASSDYRVGTFDGRAFVSETDMLPGQRGKGFYAAQTFSNIPATDGRRIQIGWMQAPSPGMPFNQCMSVPQELRLIKTPEGPRLTREPVRELESLRRESRRVGKAALKPKDVNPLESFRGEALELRALFKPGPRSVVTFTVRGIVIRYDAAKQEIAVNGHNAPAPLHDGLQRLTIYVDRTVTEVFASDGLTYVPLPVIPEAKNQEAVVAVEGEAVSFESLEAHRLGSMWRMD